MSPTALPASGSRCASGGESRHVSRHVFLRYVVKVPFLWSDPAMATPLAWQRAGAPLPHEPPAWDVEHQSDI